MNATAPVEEKATLNPSALAELRDELRLKLHLAKADAQTEWERLEVKWKELEHRFPAIETASVETGKEVGAAVRLLMEELAIGYARIKRSL